MKEKKQAANWYIGATHFLTAGFVMPLLVNLIGGLLIYSIFKEGVIAQISSLFLLVLAIWLGVKYSSNYITKNYVIKNIDEVIKFSLAFFLLSFIYLISQILNKKIVGLDILFSSVRLILSIGLFYFFSKKYLHNSEIK